MEKAPSTIHRDRTLVLYHLRLHAIMQPPSPLVPSYSAIQIFAKCTEVLMSARLWSHVGDRQVRYYLFLKEVT